MPASTPQLRDANAGKMPAYPALRIAPTPQLRDVNAGKMPARFVVDACLAPTGERWSLGVSVREAFNAHRLLSGQDARTGRSGRNLGQAGPERRRGCPVASKRRPLLAVGRLESLQAAGRAQPPASIDPSLRTWFPPQPASTPRLCAVANHECRWFSSVMRSTHHGRRNHRRLDVVISLRSRQTAFLAIVVH